VASFHVEIVAGGAYLSEFIGFAETFRAWDVVLDVACEFEGVWPESDRDSFGPVKVSMLDHGATASTERPDVALGDAVLMVGTNAAMRDVLTGVLDCGDKSALCKTSIVGVISLNTDAVTLTNALEFNLGVEGLFRVGRRLEVHIPFAGVAVAENGGAAVAVVHEESACLADQARLGAFHVIDVHSTARCLVTLVVADETACLRSAPWGTMCFAMKTRNTNGQRARHAVGWQSRDRTIFGHLTDVAEMLVAKPFMPVFQMLFGG
jgi:hypothetical protein